MRPVDLVSRLRGNGPVAAHPFLLAAYFVLFLYSQNLDEADLADVLPVLGVVLAATLLVFVVGAAVLRGGRRAGVVTSAVVIALLAYGHVAHLLVPTRLGAGVQQLGWAAFVGLALLGALRAGRWLRPSTTALNMLSGALVLVTLVPIAGHQAAIVAQGGGGPAIAVPSAAPSGQAPAGADRPDIYYFIFDRYPSERSAQLAYGIENDLYPWLRERGFYVADQSRANYQRTTLSLAATLNLAYHDGRGRPTFLGPVDRSAPYASLQNSLVDRFIKAQGYYSVHVGSDFSATRTSQLADVNLHYDAFSDFGAALFNTTALPGIGRRLGLLGSRWERRYAWTRWELDRVADLPDFPSPKFVFVHFMLPHTPYIFDRDGRFVTDEENRKRTVLERYSAQLAYTNTRIREIVEGLLDGPAENRPLIILQADEGPYPVGLEEDTRHDWTLAPPEQREIKFGILNAWYLPDGRDIGLYRSISSVNTFRLLFSGYFGADLPLLPDESFSLDHREPLEFPAR